MTNCLTIQHPNPAGYMPVKCGRHNTGVSAAGGCSGLGSMWIRNTAQKIIGKSSWFKPCIYGGYKAKRCGRQMRRLCLATAGEGSESPQTWRLSHQHDSRAQPKGQMKNKLSVSQRFGVEQLPECVHFTIGQHCTTAYIAAHNFHEQTVHFQYRGAQMDLRCRTGLSCAIQQRPDQY